MTEYRETPVTDPTETPVNPSQEERREALGWGVGLIAMGLFFLVARFLDLGLLVLPLMALGFLGWGIVTRTAGLLIPGGILGGIGLGVIAIEGPRTLATGDGEGGIFLLCFALGWLSITALSALFTDETQWWALIPGGIMAVIGGSILVGGFMLDVLGLVGTWWPLLLIGWGAYLLFRRQQRA